MSSKSEFLRADPPGNMARVGPRFRWGCLSLFFFILLSAMVIALIVLLISGEEPTNSENVMGLCIIGGLWIFFGIVLWLSSRNSRAMLTGVDVLREVLNFDLDHNINGVGVTAIIRPDEAQAGDVVSILIFMQNYYAISKRLKIVMPKSKSLGTMAKRVLKLEIGPGQCVVYRETFQIPENTHAKLYSLTGLVKSGFILFAGARLITPVRKENRFAAFHVRGLAVVMNIVKKEASSASSAETVTYCPQYISLYTPANAEPRYDILMQLTHNRADVPITV